MIDEIIGERPKDKAEGRSEPRTFVVGSRSRLVAVSVQALAEDYQSDRLNLKQSERSSSRSPTQRKPLPQWPQPRPQTTTGLAKARLPCLSHWFNRHECPRGR